MIEYTRRDALLKELGFASYAEYLQSDLWARIRRRVLGRYRSKCQACGGPASEVHHKHYSLKVLSGKHIIGLKAICRECHARIEFADGMKTALPVANRRMRQIGEANRMMRPLCAVCKKNHTKGRARICRRCKRSQ
jgi:hypothetical protein